jgi:two-component system NtrC family sensor kinase
VTDSEDRYRKIVELVPDGILTADINGVITSCNTAHVDMTGFSKAALVGKHFSELPTVRAGDIPTYAGIIASLAKGETPEPFEFTWLHRDGSSHQGEIRMALIRTEGEVTGVQAIIRDITTRAEASEALRESEEKYRSLVELSPMGIVVVNLDGVIESCNAALAASLGYSADEIVGKHFSELPTAVPGDVPHFYETYDHVLVNEELEPFDLQWIHRDGSRRWGKIEVAPLKLHGETAGFQAVVTDITHRIEAEGALRQSEAKFRTLAEQSPNMIFINKNGRVVYANRECEEVMGYARDELYAEDFDFRTLIAPESRDLVEANLRSHMNGEEVPAYEYTLMTKDGRRIEAILKTTLVQYEGETAILGTITDISERKQMESALRESEEQLAAVVQNVADAVFRFKEGQITWANDRIEEMLGYSKGEMVGLDAGLFLHSDVKMSDMYKEVGAGLEKQGFFHGNTRARRKDGSIAEIEYSASQIPGREPVELVGVARDVTARSQLEQQLQLAGRLAAVGELAAGVAHELNNPLAAVQAFAQYLADREGLDEDAKKDVGTIYREAQRASRITGNLLSFARRHPPETSFISINDVLERSLELHAYRMKVNGIDVVTELEPSVPKTMADFHQLQQVFINLITNAEQAITAARGHGRLEVKTRMAGSTIQITFADDGPGVAEEHVTSIFDPFFTTKGVGEGTGLGLSICHGIISEHGGSIHVDSQPDQGTTFAVELPVVSEGHTQEHVVSS